MKFYINEEFQSSHFSLEEGLRAISKIALIHVNELEAMFPMNIMNCVDTQFVLNRATPGKIWNPYFPFLVHVLTPDEQIHNHSSSVGPVVTRNVSKALAGHRLLPKGSRTTLQNRDVLVWIFANWVRDMVTMGKEGCFLDDDGRIPHVREFMYPFMASSLPTPPFDPLNPREEIDSSSKPYLEYIKYGTCGPFKSVRDEIFDWIDSTRMISIVYSETGHIQICQGELNTILAYHAYKEGVRPTCLMPMF